ALPDSVVSGRSIDAKAPAKVDPSTRPEAKTGKAPSRSKAATQRDAKNVEANEKVGAASARDAKDAKAAKHVGSPTSLPTGAVAAKLPDALEPELATLVAAAPDGDEWTYEVKFDGYRILARIDDSGVRLLTRNGKDWTAKLKGVAASLERIGLPPGWFDGEIVVLGQNGASDFGALQNAFDADPDRIVYVVFDVPYLAGQDLRAAKLEDRRALLAGLLADAKDQVRFSQDFAADATDILRSACRLRLEGVIGKRLGSHYVSGRTREWIKLKCTLRQEFVIGGYTEPQGSRTGLGALLLGIHDERRHLRYAGYVGTGFDTKTLAALKKQLSAIESTESPFFEKPRDARGTWVEPKLVAEVSFAEWTQDGKVRHAVFHGLRSDKPADDITVERPAAPAHGNQAASGNPAARSTIAAKPMAASKKTPGAVEREKEAVPKTPASRASSSRTKATPAANIGSALPSGVRITHPERVIDPSSHRTKQDLVDYYVHAAKRLLPHLARRPVAVVRAPAGIDGQLFFQKHSGSLTIADLVELPPELDPGHPPLIEIDSFTALVSAAQMNVVELHTWNASSRRIEKPDRMTFDLDPGEGVAWPQMVEAARATRALLDEIGLRSFLKTSGGKGLHIVVPLTPRDGWDDVKDFSREVVELLSARQPDRIVAKSGPKNRVGKIFIDYLRNGRGATTAAAFSARARPGLGVSIPCDWDELDGLRGGDHWTLATAHERLESSVDPWREYATMKQTLLSARKALGKNRDK
ncbi:MAG: DNA ligase D, partial [Caldimonas sp.]